MKGLVPFNLSAFESGIRLAMGLGLPDDVGLQPTFVFSSTAVLTGLSVDEEGLPFDPAAKPPVAAGPKKLARCAVEYLDSRGEVLDIGIAQASQARLTMLNTEYQSIKGFVYVLLGGSRFDYRETAPPIGLADATVWQVMVATQDQA